MPPPWLLGPAVPCGGVIAASWNWLGLAWSVPSLSSPLQQPAANTMTPAPSITSYHKITCRSEEFLFVCLFVCSGMIGICSVGISFSGILAVLRNRWKHLNNTGNVRSYSGVLTDLMTISLWLRWCKMDIFLKPHEVKSFLISYLEEEDCYYKVSVHHFKE